jgi:hypothetical protein
LLEANGIEIEDGELLTSADSVNGRARFSGPAGDGFAAQGSGPHLGDIHGHDQQELFSHDSQLAMVDHAGDTGEGPSRRWPPCSPLAGCFPGTRRARSGRQEKAPAGGFVELSEAEIEEAAEAGRETGLDNERRSWATSRASKNTRRPHIRRYEAQGSAIAR